MEQRALEGKRALRTYKVNSPEFAQQGGGLWADRWVGHLRATGWCLALNGSGAGPSPSQSTSPPDPKK